MLVARAMWALIFLVLAGVLEIPAVVSQECGSSSDQKVGLVAAGAAVDGQDGFTTMRRATDVATFVRGDSAYAIVPSYMDDGIQILDVTDPSSPEAVGSATDGQGGFTRLERPHGVSTFVLGDNTYAIVAASGDDGIQILNVTDPSSPVAVGTATDRGVLELAGAFGVSTFVLGDNTYAIVAARDDDGIQILDVSDPSSPVPVGSATDGQGGFTTLAGPRGVSTFVLGDNTYAIVAAFGDNGIQIVDVSDPSSPVPVGSATHGQGGFTMLVGSRGVSTFVLGDNTYAIVAASVSTTPTAEGGGIQIVDVSDPSYPVAVGRATDGQGGFTTLAGARDSSTFVLGGSTYAIVASAPYAAGGIQLLDVSDPSSPVAVGSATDGQRGFTAVNGAVGASTFVLGDTTYAIVASSADDGIQLVSLPDCSGAPAPDSEPEPSAPAPPPVVFRESFASAATAGMAAITGALAAALL